MYIFINRTKVHVSENYEKSRSNKLLLKEIIINKYNIILYLFLLALLGYILIFSLYLLKVISLNTFNIFIYCLFMYNFFTLAYNIFAMFITRKYLVYILYIFGVLLITVLLYFSFWIVIGVATTN